MDPHYANSVQIPDRRMEHMNNTISEREHEESQAIIHDTSSNQFADMTISHNNNT